MSKLSLSVIKREKILKMNIILLIEDDDEIRDFLKILIASSEFEIVTARNEIIAWNTLNSRKIDLVVTSEEPLSFLINQKFADIPIIMTSSFGSNEADLHGFIHSFLPKPFRPDELKMRIENILCEIKKRN